MEPALIASSGTCTADCSSAAARAGDSMGGPALGPRARGPVIGPSLGPYYVELSWVSRAGTVSRPKEALSFAAAWSVVALTA